MAQWLGIAVCQRWSTVPLRSQGTSLRVSNNDSSMSALLTQRKLPSAVRRISLESTGGSKRQVALLQRHCNGELFWARNDAVATVGFELEVVRRYI